MCCGGGSRVPVSQSRVAQLKQGHVRIHQREDQGRPHELTLKESARYLGSILHEGASNKEELRNRVTQANTVHGRKSCATLRYEWTLRIGSPSLGPCRSAVSREMANQEVEASGTQSGTHHKRDK